ncbi:MAG: P22 phage major capsid protein family protein [Burkholderiales bacterium]
MANANLTPDDITREALRVLHQKLNFVTNIVTEYDDSFAVEGAKIGNTLRIRQPIQYTTGTGATIATGTTIDSQENSTTLTVNSQKHVPMRFTSNEMTMKIDDFSSRHIEPAMAVLAAKIESDALSMVSNVYNHIAAGTKVEFADVMDGRRKLVDNLAPGNDRFALLDTQANADLVNELKGLFQDSDAIKKQYKEGMMGRTGGFDFYENTLLPSHTTGAEAGGAVYDVNGNQSHTYDKFNDATLAVVTGTKTIKKGDVFTIANVYRVHPETKLSTGELQEFTVRTDHVGGAGTLDISPGIIITGPYQNCSAQAATGAAITFKGAASTAYKQSLLFQKGFACFATADLVLPTKGVMAASRQVYDGISMRMVQDYDVVKDRIYTRLDVLYGYKILRPQLAVKVLHT